MYLLEYKNMNYYDAVMMDIINVIMPQFTPARVKNSLPIAVDPDTSDV